MEKIIHELMILKEQYENTPISPDAKEVSREEFTLLLSGIASCRKMPGVAVHMGYETLYHCTGEEDIAQGLKHLKTLYGVTDKDSLINACYQIFSGSREYEQFMTFWHDAPLFDLNELTSTGKKGFAECETLAKNFYPLVKEKGFYAWDISERIGLCRKAAAVSIITDEDFWQITDSWVRQAQVFYHSFGEYATSCLSGALYEMGRYQDDIIDFFEINRNMIAHLMEEGGAWQRNKWYTPTEREWAEILPSNPACFITKKALDLDQIHYMYRETPDSEYPDSGWRFFYGDEPEEYLNDPKNTVLCGLNTVCNLNPDILAFIHAKAGRQFGKYEDGWREE